MKAALINIALFIILFVMVVCIISGQIQKIDLSPNVAILAWFGQYIVLIGGFIGLIYNNK